MPELFGNRAAIPGERGGRVRGGGWGGGGKKRHAMRPGVTACDGSSIDL